jgi:hypothetical protein
VPGFRVLDPLFFERNVCRSDLVHPTSGFSLEAFNDVFSRQGFLGFSHSCLQFLSLVMLVCSRFDVCSDRGPLWRVLVSLSSSYQLGGLARALRSFLRACNVDALTL